MKFSFPVFYLSLLGRIQQLYYVANHCAREFVYQASQVLHLLKSVTEMIYIIKYNNKFLTELAQGCYNVLYLRKVAGIGPTDFATNTAR
jgi:hypothetical protein